MIKRLYRDYEVTLNFEASREDKQLFVLATMYENATLKQVDNSLIDLIAGLEAAGHVITMAEISYVDVDGSRKLPNTMFLSLTKIPQGITKTEVKNGQIN